ncbi:hypothetical protein J5N97_004585 [Dioscorea zingiberensis]|uniref:Uncharacterized protein n=1 Tax=Dioscorea zingiberensis TaxID=325984 RepID=A0A9D5D874_9LILI|nr:hypothetical protein J5N97_004585 [Dioscorea zingiberensis]
MDLMILSLLWFFTLILLSSGDVSNNITINSLNTVVRDNALQALLHHRTGIVFKVPTPMNLSGIEVSGKRIRSKTLWRTGVDIGQVHVPSGAIAVPHVKRLIIVYQSLGNWSSTFFDIPGYTLEAPVVGFQAYDASNLSSKNITELGFNATDPITIRFILEGMKPELKCASFGLNRTVTLYKMVSPNVCYGKTPGYFGIVTPVLESRASTGRKWIVWLIVGGNAVVGMMMVGLVWLRVFRLARNKKMGIEDGEALGSVRVGNTNMPFAAMVRTQPVLETG